MTADGAREQKSVPTLKKSYLRGRKEMIPIEYNKQFRRKKSKNWVPWMELQGLKIPTFFPLFFQKLVCITRSRGQIEKMYFFRVLSNMLSSKQKKKTRSFTDFANTFCNFIWKSKKWVPWMELQGPENTNFFHQPENS